MIEEINQPAVIESAAEQNKAAVGGVAECAEENEAEATTIAPASDAAEGVESPHAVVNVSESGRVDNNLAGQSVVMVKPSDLNLNPASSKIYGEEVPAALVTSIEDEGIRTPLIVDRATSRVISGNTRLRIALKLNIPGVPIIYADMGEESLTMLASNVTREKTRMAMVREFVTYLEMEKRDAKLRRKGKAKVPNLEPNKKSRDRAADKVGISASSLETGQKVVGVIDKLESDGDLERAKSLRDALNTKGFEPAYQMAVSIGQLEPKTDKAADDTNLRKREKKPKVQEEPASHGAENEVGEIKICGDLEDHIKALETLAVYCREDASMLDEAAKKRLGDAFAATSKAMADAGIISAASLN